MKTEADIDMDELVALLKKMHGNRIRLKKTERWQGRRARCLQMKQYGFTWEQVARLVQVGSGRTVYSLAADDRGSLLDELRDKHGLYRSEFEKMTGLREGDRVPDWIPIHLGSGNTDRQAHFRAHTDGTLCQAALKKLLMGRAGEIDFSAFEVDHRLGFDKAVVCYADGWFTAKLDDGSDWHSPGNVRLINPSDHADKSRKENILSIKRRIENGTHHFLRNHCKRTRQSFNNTKKAQELYAKGRSQAQIARYIGVSHTSVSRMLKRDLRQYAEFCSVEYDESSRAN